MKKKPLTNKEGDVRELTSEDMNSMRSAKEILPDDVLSVLPKLSIGQRGKQKQPTKVSVTLRYSQEVIAYFKSTGDGWQIRMDAALKEWIRDHQHAA